MAAPEMLPQLVPQGHSVSIPYFLILDAMEGL